MASPVESLPKNGTSMLEKHDSFADEKSADEKQVVPAVQGDVYDDVRAIDLGEDGKERPIGISSSLSSCFSLKKIIPQRPMLMSLLVSSPSKTIPHCLASLSGYGSLVLVFLALVQSWDKFSYVLTF